MKKLQSGQTTSFRIPSMPIVSFWRKTNIPLVNLLMTIKHCIFYVVDKKSSDMDPTDQNCCCEQVVSFVDTKATEWEVEETDDNGEVVEAAAVEDVDEAASRWRLESLAAVQDEGHDVEKHHVHQDEAEE